MCGDAVFVAESVVGWEGGVVGWGAGFAVALCWLVWWLGERVLVWECEDVLVFGFVLTSVAATIT